MCESDKIHVTAFKKVFLNLGGGWFFGRFAWSVIMGKPLSKHLSGRHTLLWKQLVFGLHLVSLTTFWRKPTTKSFCKRVPSSTFSRTYISPKSFVYVLQTQLPSVFSVLAKGFVRRVEKLLCTAMTEKAKEATGTKRWIHKQVQNFDFTFIGRVSVVVILNNINFDWNTYRKLWASRMRLLLQQTIKFLLQAHCVGMDFWTSL